MNRKQETINFLQEMIKLIESNQYPEFEYLRFGQLLLNATKKESILYNIESSDLTEKIKSYLLRKE